METTQNAANVDFFEIWNQNREQYVKSPCVRKETSDTLLPFISAVHTHHTTRLEGLKIKTAATKERIAGLEKELQHLQNSVDQLNDNVTMLRALGDELGMPLPFTVLIESTERQLNRLLEKSIPKCEDNLRAEKTRIGKLEHKAAVAQAKADRSKAFSDVIRSFAILNPTERREKFSKAMDALHDASKRVTGFKIAKCESKLEKLKKERETAISSAHRVRLAEKIERTEYKLRCMQTDLQQMDRLPVSYANQTQDKQDEMIAKTAFLLDAVAEQDIALPSFSVENIAQSICYLHSYEADLEQSAEIVHEAPTKDAKNDQLEATQSRPEQPQSADAQTPVQKETVPYKMMVTEQQFAALADSGLPLKVARKDDNIVILCDQSIKDQVKAIANQALQPKAAAKK